MTQEEIFRAAFDAIAPLSAGELALLLQMQGIRGVREDASACPLAIYFSSRLACGVSVDLDVTLENGDWLHCTEAMNEFVTGFDDGKYPELQE